MAVRLDADSVRDAIIPTIILIQCQSANHLNLRRDVIMAEVAVSVIRITRKRRNQRDVRLLVH